MEKLKVKVGNEAESKEAQELFSEFGLNMNGWSEFAFPKYISNFMDGEFSDYSIYDSGLDDWKEITLPELRDLVVLKRNDVGDVTHTDQYGDKWIFVSGIWYFYSGKNKLDQTLTNLMLRYELKPIEKKEMKEYLVKSQDGNWREETTLTGDPADTVIEIPAGAEKYIQLSGNNRSFYKNGFKEFWYSGKWLETTYNDANLKAWSGFPVLWQRENLNNQVASAEEFKQPEDLPFLDNGVDIGVENLPDFTPEFPSEKEIKTDFPLNRGDVNYRMARAFNEIRGTDLTEDDLDFIRKLIDLTISHYTDRF